MKNKTYYIDVRDLTEGALISLLEAMENVEIVWGSGVPPANEKQIESIVKNGVTFLYIQDSRSSDRVELVYSMENTPTCLGDTLVEFKLPKEFYQK